MNRISRIVAGLITAAMLGGVLAAQGGDLNVKLGLWEMTLTVDMSNGVPGLDTSKMTPEQRAQVETMMRGRGMAPTVVKNCMTKEKLAAHKYTNDRPGQTCTSVVTKSAATSTDVTQTCTGAQPSTNEMHIEAPTPTTVTLTAKQTSGRGTGAVVNIAGKWLATDCGDVK